MSASRFAILLFVVLAIVQYVYFKPLLPDQMASHFDAAGEPDGWTSKSAFLAGNLVFVGGVAALFLGLTSLVRKIPNAWINLPNKDYWLAPERRDETMNLLQSQMEWLGAATLALLVGITQLTITANLSGEPLKDGAFWVLFGGYMLLMAVWLIRLLRWSYRKPPVRDDII